MFRNVITLSSYSVAYAQIIIDILYLRPVQIKVHINMLVITSNKLAASYKAILPIHEFHPVHIQEANCSPSSVYDEPP